MKAPLISFCPADNKAHYAQACYNYGKVLNGKRKPCHFHGTKLYFATGWEDKLREISLIQGRRYLPGVRRRQAFTFISASIW